MHHKGWANEMPGGVIPDLQGYMPSIKDAPNSVQMAAKEAKVTGHLPMFAIDCEMVRKRQRWSN